MGHHNIAYHGDAHALHGAWSPPTSKANFCEEDYIITFYIAEFINSLTNIAYIYFALRYMYSGPSSSSLLPKRWDSMSLTLFVLGICSFLFHASLRQTLQFADELGMLGLAWSLSRDVSLITHPHQKTPITAGLTVFYLLFGAFYVWTGEIFYHAMGFLGILFLIIGRTWWLLYRRVGDGVGYLSRRKVEGRKGRAGWMFGVACFGYGLWNVDLEFCKELRWLREVMGLPWAWGLELHGWWHVLTALSASLFMDMIREMQEEMGRGGEGKNE